MKRYIPFLKDFKQTGAIAPSSVFLAKEMVQPLKQKLSDDRCPPQSILEIGAGTGPFTRELIKVLRPQDRLDIVEIHERFYDVISSRYSERNVHIHHTDILHFDTDQSYDFILSGLPYENIPPEISNRIWKKKLKLCSDSAWISYFKYVKFKKFKNPFEREIVNRNLHSRDTVLLNLPPAFVYTLQINGHSGDLYGKSGGLANTL